MNRSLAYYMKAKEILKADVEESLTTYFKQCSMLLQTMFNDGNGT